jgi:1-acyl-sn-glycerol-3-phosphate acyltransferase
MAYWFFYIIMNLIDRIYFQSKFYNTENLPEDGKCIIATNHISNLDPFVMGICQKRRFSFLAKEELFKKGFQNWAFRQMGAFPIKRGASDFKALRESIRRVKSGTPLILFPEGTRGTGNIEKRSQAGIGFIAIKANVPIVPAYIEGTDKALPNGAKWFKRHPVKVTFGKPLKFEKGIPFSEISQSVLTEVYNLKENLPV